MARGWESKSVEAQIDMAETPFSSAVPGSKLTSRQLEVVRHRETILLSRTRVIRELSTAQNPRYKGILNKALADLDAQLETFAAV